MSGQAESIQILERISNLQGLTGNVAELTKRLNARSAANVKNIKGIAVKVTEISKAIKDNNLKRKEVQGQLDAASVDHRNKIAELNRQHEDSIKNLKSNHAAELEGATAQSTQSSAEKDALQKKYEDLLEAINQANTQYNSKSKDLLSQLDTLSISENSLTEELQKLANQVNALSAEIGINDSGTGNDGASTDAEAERVAEELKAEAERTTSAKKQKVDAAKKEPPVEQSKHGYNLRPRGGSRKKRRHSSKKRRHITRRKHNSKKKHGGRRSLKKHKKDHKKRRPIKRVTFKHHR